MQKKLREMNNSTNSRDIRKKIKMFKRGKEQLKRIEEKVNKEDADQRSPEEIHETMSLIENVYRISKRIKNYLRSIKEGEKERTPKMGRSNREAKKKRLLEELDKFNHIMGRLKRQTTQIGLVSSSLSHFRQSEYENSLDTSMHVDTGVPPSNEYPISIDNSEKNQVSTLCSEILSRTDSVGVEGGTDFLRFDNSGKAELGKKMRMRKKREGEILQIGSKKRRETETSGSQLNSLPVSKFEEGVVSPIAKGRKRRKLYSRKAK